MMIARTSTSDFGIATTSSLGRPHNPRLDPHYPPAVAVAVAVIMTRAMLVGPDARVHTDGGGSGRIPVLVRVPGPAGGGD
jgi:hypothetical protein